MKKLRSIKSFIILIVLQLVLLNSCGVCKPGTTTIIHYKDSTVTHTVDSVVYIPKERIVDVVRQYDTLRLESSVAKSESYVDTLTHTLKGSLTNKKDIQYKYKYITKTEYRDSIVTVEKPVYIDKEVIKHKHYFYEPILWFFTVLSLGYIGFKIWKKTRLGI